MQPVQIVTILQKLPLFKGETPADKIELIRFEENGFEVVAGKGLYEVGDSAVYIQPDYCLPDIPLFESFLRPNGDESKSMLGKVGGLPRRIRAKKFNFSILPNSSPVYSNGILLPKREVNAYLDSINWPVTNLDFGTALQITKYEEPEETTKGGLKSGQTAGKWPDGLYKTDEDNINNVWGKLQFPIWLVGTEKCDGSSVAIGLNDHFPDGFICSRNLRKRLKINKVVGRRKKTFLETLLFWTKPDLNIYEEMDNDDDFVRYGKPLLDKLKEAGLMNVILRGELNGGSLKGSGNKNNPASKEPANIKLFGVDVFENGAAQRVNPQMFFNFCEKHNFQHVKLVFNQMFNSKEELQETCDNYFKTNLIEGIVVRGYEGFSAKYMNNEYDSKK